jgi:hypothetical protein
MLIDLFSSQRVIREGCKKGDRRQEQVKLAGPCWAVNPPSFAAHARNRPAVYGGFAERVFGLADPA